MRLGHPSHPFNCGSVVDRFILPIAAFLAAAFAMLNKAVAINVKGVLQSRRFCYAIQLYVRLSQLISVAMVGIPSLFTVHRMDNGDD